MVEGAAAANSKDPFKSLNSTDRLKYVGLGVGLGALTLALYMGYRVLFKPKVRVKTLESEAARLMKKLKKIQFDNEEQIKRSHLVRIMRLAKIKSQLAEENIKQKSQVKRVAALRQ